MFTVEYCKKVEITNNSLQGDILGKNIQLVATPKPEVKVDTKQGIVMTDASTH